MSATLELAHTAGWYGKLASLGDFAQRRLPQECVQLFDGWMSAAMQDGQARLGDRWLDVYLTAPVLRFAFAPGIVDARWWFGVLMASCDNVGRYFPLLIAQPRNRAPEDRIAFDHLELWYEQLSQAALRTLGDGDSSSVAAFEAALDDAPLWPTPGRGAALTSRDEAYGRHLRIAGAASLTSWLRSWATLELGERLSGCTLWWRVSEDRAADEVDLVHGLPDGDTFARLLEANRAVA
ncbi:MAG: type VI secretion system-associated protein TagF [Pseudomonadota bacterium]|nr:type VI secretion system-associated protein TagF [Pseudomonadota bacterium]